MKLPILSAKKVIKALKSIGFEITRQSGSHIIMVKYKDGKKWVQEITANYGALDGFVSGDNYVIDLLKQHYNIIHSSDMIPKEKWIYIKGSMVRAEMARGGDAWKAYVPKEVADYICKNKLDERFRKEFGLETLSTFADMKYMRQESSAQEKAHTMEV